MSGLSKLEMSAFMVGGGPGPQRNPKQYPRRKRISNHGCAGINRRGGVDEKGVRIYAYD